jgi:hypothetical protein
VTNQCGGTFTAVPGSSSLSLTGGTLAPTGPPPQRHWHARAGASQVAPASGLCTITVDLLVTGTGTLSNTTGAISANESGPGNPSNAATINVVLSPTVSAAFGAATIPQGGTTSLTFNVANPNTFTQLDSIDLPDSLPAGLVVASPNGLIGSCVPSSTITADPGSSSLELSALNLPAAGSCSFSVNVTGATAGTKNNTTDDVSGLFDDGSGDFVKAIGGTASASLVVVGPPVLATSFGAISTPVGSSTSLSYTITNPNALPLSGVAFTDTLPAGLVVSTPSGLSTTCVSGTVTATAGSVTLSGAQVGADATCTVAVNVTGTSEGVEQESATASSTNGGTGAPASTRLFVGLPPSITSAFAPMSIMVGATTTLSFTLKNPNTATTLSGIALSDTLPAGLVVGSPSGAQGSCGGGMLTAVPGSGTFSLAGGQLAPGASCTVSLTIKATQAGMKQNSVGPVSSTQSGAAGSAPATVTVAPLPSSQFAVRNIKPSANGHLSLQITVPGPGTADILETAPLRDFSASAAAADGPHAPGSGRFAFARAHVVFMAAGTSLITVKPTARAKRLLRHRHRTVRINLWVTYTPANGMPRTKAVLGLLAVR